MILPYKGRWQGEALTEGGFHIGCPLWRSPSTILRMVTLPVPGRVTHSAGS